MKLDINDFIIRAALCEDLSPQFARELRRYLQGLKPSLIDVTSSAIFRGEECEARVTAKSEGVLSGSAPFRRVFELVDPSVQVSFSIKDGSHFKKGQVVSTLKGKIKSILMGERTALNFLGHLSGIATEVRKLVKVLEGTGINLLDTRKTLPGLRALEKKAVEHGGGFNHRMGLYDMVLIKDNHIDGAGSISEAVRRVRAANGRKYKVETEARTLSEVKEALDAGVDRIMLDNMSVDLIKKAARMAAGRVELEVSGNVTQKKLAALRGVRIDFVSIGYITHSTGHADFSLGLTRISHKNL